MLMYAFRRQRLVHPEIAKKDEIVCEHIESKGDHIMGWEGEGGVPLPLHVPPFSYTEENVLPH